MHLLRHDRPANISAQTEATPPSPQAARALGGLWVFLLCAAFLAGPGYGSCLDWDLTRWPDVYSYMEMSKGNFDVTVTHKYRFVVPLLAGAVRVPIETIFGIVWPHRDDALSHLRLSFFLVNYFFMSLTGWVLYRTCQAYGLSLVSSGFAVGAFLASRFTVSLGSIPMADSFHVLAVALAFLALKTQNGRLLAVAILLGPISKESFVFIVPATLLFGSLRVWVQLLLYACSATIVLVAHLAIDWHFPVKDVGSVTNALNHFHNIGFSLRRGLSPGGLGEIFSVLGLFNLVWLYALTQPNRRSLWQALDAPLWFLLFSVIVQALISTSLGRMLYVAAPFWVVLVGASFGSLLRASSERETLAGVTNESLSECANLTANSHG